MHLASGLRALLGVVSVAWLAACLPLPTAVGVQPVAPDPTPGPLASPPALVSLAPASPGASVAPASSRAPASPGEASPSPLAASPAPSPADRATPPPGAATPASPLPGAPTPAPSPAFTPPVGADGPWAVSRVVDGDTVHVTTDAGNVTLRLIGVDTPESVHPTQPVECYGPEASAYAKSTLTGQRVWLESDATQDRLDRYGRRLVYVWLPDGTLFNEALIATGHATEYTYSRAYVHQARFRAAQAAARAAGRGMWGACTGLPSPLPSPAPAPAASPAATAAPEAAVATPTPTPSCPPGERWVNPYVRSDGTQVRGYCRKAS